MGVKALLARVIAFDAEKKGLTTKALFLDRKLKASPNLTSVRNNSASGTENGRWAGTPPYLMSYLIRAVTTLNILFMANDTFGLSENV